MSPPPRPPVVDYGHADEAECRSCGAPIYFWRQPSGRVMPVDREPAGPREPRGLYARAGQGFRSLTAHEKRGAGPAHLPHFATCPNASKWRKRDQPD